MTFAVNPRLTGILCALGAAASFSANDMLVRLMSGDYPLHEIVLFRSTIGLLTLLVVIVPLEGGWRILRTPRPAIHMLRGLAVVAANMSFFMAIVAMPLASASAIFFVAPLLIAALSVVFLGETVGPRRWAAIGVGMAGVLIVMRPGAESFRLAALLPLFAAFAYACLHILTRKLGLAEKASTMAFYIQLTFILVSSAFGLTVGDGALAGGDDPSLEFLFRAWVWPAASDLKFFVLLGVLSAGAGYLISQAYRLAEAGLVAPFEYVALLMAAFWGYAIWGEVPALSAAAGMALILGAGLYLALREAALGRRQSARKASARRV